MKHLFLLLITGLIFVSVNAQEYYAIRLLPALEENTRATLQPRKINNASEVIGSINEKTVVIWDAHNHASNSTKAISALPSKYQDHKGLGIDINNRNELIGYFIIDGKKKAFIYSRGAKSLQMVEPLEGYTESIAVAINDMGNSVYTFVNQTSKNTQAHYRQRSGGVFKVSIGNDIIVAATDLDEYNNVVGFFREKNTVHSTSEMFIDFSQWNSSPSNDITAAQGFIWNGDIQDSHRLKKLSNTSAEIPQGINANNGVVGIVIEPSIRFSGAHWSTPTSELEILNNTLMPSAINNNGQIVGLSIKGKSGFAFLKSPNEELIDLNSVLINKLPKKLSLQRAIDINDNGYILCLTKNKSVAYVLIPTQ